MVRMDFPARPAVACELPAGLADALGADVRWCGRSIDDLLVELPHASVVRELAPDVGALAGFPVRGVIVTAASDVPGHDFVSRFYAPASGVPEDPVTGSAHCTLGPYWAARLGRASLRGWQASRRGGSVAVECRGERVVLGGRAVTMLRGEWAAGWEAAGTFSGA
jgi:predicted PhzF superfamily epimerase YddE/YHI9